MNSARAAALAFPLLAAVAPAGAMVGGAPPAAAGAGRSVVMILGSYGTVCTATAIAPELLLTAAHCVAPGADYKLACVLSSGKAVFKNIVRIARDPQFDLNRLLAHRATADVALAKLARPLPVAMTPLDDAATPATAGEGFVVAGYGVTVRGDAAAALSAPPGWSPPDGPTAFSCDWSIRRPGAEARASAPVPAIPARRCFETRPANSPSSAS